MSFGGEPRFVGLVEAVFFGEPVLTLPTLPTRLTGDPSEARFGGEPSAEGSPAEGFSAPQVDLALRTGFFEGDVGTGLPSPEFTFLTRRCTDSSSIGYLPTDIVFLTGNFGAFLPTDNVFLTGDFGERLCAV